MQQTSKKFSQYMSFACIKRHPDISKSKKNRKWLTLRMKIIKLSNVLLYAGVLCFWLLAAIDFLPICGTNCLWIQANTLTEQRLCILHIIVNYMSVSDFDSMWIRFGKDCKGNSNYYREYCNSFIRNWVGRKLFQ